MVLPSKRRIPRNREEIERQIQFAGDSLFEGADVASKDPERETAIIDKWLFPRHLSVVSADECLLESLDLREEDSNRVIPGTLMEIKAKTELEEREAV